MTPLRAMPNREPSTFLPPEEAQKAWWTAIRRGNLDLLHHRMAEDPRWARLLSMRGWVALHEILTTPDYGSLAKRLQMIDAVLPHTNVRWDDTHPGDSTPLILAAQSCQIEVIRRLLPLSNPRAATAHGMTALHMAASCGHEEVVRELLPLSDPQAVTTTGHTPVMLAAVSGRLAATQELWPSADQKVRNRDGDTVVLLAAKAGLTPILDRWMDDPRADFTARNHDGQDVTDLWRIWTAKAPTPDEHARRLRRLNALVAFKQIQERAALDDAWPTHLATTPSSGRPRL